MALQYDRTPIKYQSDFFLLFVALAWILFSIQWIMLTFSGLIKINFKIEAIYVWGLSRDLAHKIVLRVNLRQKRA